VNVLFSGDEALVGILPSGSPVHPWAIAAPIDPVTVRLGYVSSCEEGTLCLGACSLALDALNCVDLALRHRPASLARGMDSLRHVAAGREPTAFDRTVDRAISGFVETQDPSVLLALVGVGEGLTPTGDDVIVGIVAALDSLSAADVSAGALHAGLVQQLSHAVTGRTTRLAAQLILSACGGEYAEPLRDLLHCIAADPIDQRTLGASARAVAALGHDSGVSLIRGVVAGVDCVARRAVAR
jgi:hypothetical protein